jgi:hypothetical protein
MNGSSKFAGEIEKATSDYVREKLQQRLAKLVRNTETSVPGSRFEPHDALSIANLRGAIS